MRRLERYLWLALRRPSREVYDFKCSVNGSRSLLVLCGLSFGTLATLLEVDKPPRQHQNSKWLASQIWVGLLPKPLLYRPNHTFAHPGQSCSHLTTPHHFLSGNSDSFLHISLFSEHFKLSANPLKTFATFSKTWINLILSGSEGFLKIENTLLKHFLRWQKCFKSVCQGPRLDALKSGTSTPLKKDPTEIAYEIWVKIRTAPEMEPATGMVMRKPLVADREP